MKYRCLIVEDEPIAQQIIETYISKLDALQLVGTCNNAFDALNVLHRESIDLLFLDIKMPSLSGLDMLKTLQNRPKVILTTAYSEFGVESYDYGITDYLLKPISFERFLKAVNKLLVTQAPEIAPKPIDQDIAPDSTFFFFKSDKKIHKYYFADILFIEGSGNYVKVHTKGDKPLMVLDKLSDLQDKLPKPSFLRIHKSYIVNIRYIDNVEGNLVTINGQPLPISASFKQQLEGLIHMNR